MLRIDGAAILDPLDGLLPCGCLLIEGPNIAWVGEHPPADMPPAGQTLDGDGLLAMPGLVNTHSHLAMTLMRGYADDLPLQKWLQEVIWPLESRLEEEDIYRGAMLGAVEMIRGGTTTFADMYWSAAATARAAAESGLRASLCNVIIGRHPQEDRLFAEAAELCRTWHGAADGRIRAMIGPHAPYTCPPQTLEKALLLAEEMGVRLHTHLSETATELADCLNMHGQSPTARLASLGLFRHPTLAAHCVHLLPGDPDILAAHGVSVAHCPGSNLKLGSGIAPLPRLLQAGVNVCLGTDGAASNNNLDMFEEMRLAALLHKAVSQDPTTVSAAEALTMATVSGAAALGLPQSGRLRAGCPADIVLLDLRAPHLQPGSNHLSGLVYSASAADVHTVIVNGRILMHNRCLSELDEEAIKARARESAERLGLS